MVILPTEIAAIREARDRTQLAIVELSKSRFGNEPEPPSLRKQRLAFLSKARKVVRKLSALIEELENFGNVGK